ncbi:SPOR domain-containing protein [Phenylobacterium kunshanense]|uniref:SPOR domain-containing protein n=1 Tax=Phenylobacterium kunshanense TaxID=1445034 RepID=A0A328B7Y9_9CAUL|nr:SPOR domain-containing protein [Phenylobacterium kunshanense]RAK62036.1 SPOR domain-containing protein [Phenylobacterium kunshanense]
MTDQERGAYTPPTADAPLSFDPRQPVRGARPIPFTLILSVLVLAALVAAIFMFYQQGVRQAGQAPQVVGESIVGMKQAAPPGAQPQDPAAGLQIYRSDAGGPMETVPAEPTFAPPPEQPQARPTTPVVITQAPPAQPAPTSAPIKATIPAEPVQKAEAPAPAPKVAAAAPKAAPPPPKAAAPAPEPKKVAAAEPKASSGAARVQVGAVSSTALADKAWNDAVSAAPGLAAGKGKAVAKIEGGSLYRTFVTGFSSRADAQAFCARLQAAGKSCFVR